jgi:superfamily II DNA or RNA helicase
MTQKAVISNRIYFRPESDEQLTGIMQALTYKIEDKTVSPKAKFKNITMIRNYKILPQGLVSVPQGRTDLVPEDVELVDKRVVNYVPFPTPKFELNSEQLKVYDEANDSCFINAKVGWGKTFTSLHIAAKLGQKTLVVTHTVMLRDQWVEEIENLFGMRPGIIGADTFDIDDHALVVGNIQTVTKLLPKISKEFGTVILDEAHHVPADTFSSLVDGMYCRYRIALSGTMIRQDGKHVVFRDYFGDTVFKPKQFNTLNPKVKILQTGIRLPTGLPWVKKINTLLYDEDYQNLVAGIALRNIELGHSVLVIADRVEFLQNIQELVGETCVLITGKTGSSSEGDYEERKRLIEEVNSGKKMCIAGSRQIFSEGISVNRLSCVIIATPTSNAVSLEQIIGRIMRQHPDKLEPVVIDLNFSSAAERKQDAARYAFYIGQGWEVTKV